MLLNFANLEVLKKFLKSQENSFKLKTSELMGDTYENERKETVPLDQHVLESNALTFLAATHRKFQSMSVDQRKPRRNFANQVIIYEN